MMAMMWNDLNDGCGCLSERGLLGFLWDSWDLVLVVGGIALGESVWPRTSPVALTLALSRCCWAFWERGENHDCHDGE